MISRFEQAVLLSICLANKGSLSSHVPKPYFMKKFPGKTQKHAEKALHSLISLNYVYVHPNRGETTYGITQLLLDVCRDLRDKGFSVSGLLAPE
jgi:hypothetical protein